MGFTILAETRTLPKVKTHFFNGIKRDGGGEKRVWLTLLLPELAYST